MKQLKITVSALLIALIIGVTLGGALYFFIATPKQLERIADALEANGAAAAIEVWNRRAYGGDNKWQAVDL